MAKFNIGDRVRFTGNNLIIAKGSLGTYKGEYIGALCPCSLVEWDNGVPGFMHDGRDKEHGPRCKPGTGWAVPKAELELVEVKPEVKLGKVIIYQQDEKTIIAKDISTGKTAKAVCSSDDTFDFGYGATLALSRLYPGTKEAEPKAKAPMPELQDGYFVEILDYNDGQVYPAMIMHNVDDKLCVSGRKIWFPVSVMDEYGVQTLVKTNKVLTRVLRVYGRTHNRGASIAESLDRKLLWEA